MRLYSFASHIVRYLVVRGLHLYIRANGSVAKANSQPRSRAHWCDKVASLHASLQLTMGLEVLNFHLNPSFFLLRSRFHWYSCRSTNVHDQTPLILNRCNTLLRAHHLAILDLCRNVCSSVQPHTMLIRSLPTTESNSSIWCKVASILTFSFVYGQESRLGIHSKNEVTQIYLCNTPSE